MLILDGFVLDLTSLIGGFHSAENTATRGDTFEFLEDRFLDQLREFLDKETSLVRIFVLRNPPFPVDNHLNSEGSTDRLFGRCGDRLVGGVGMERVTVDYQPGMGGCEERK